MLTTPEAETDTAPAPLYEIHIANVTRYVRRLGTGHLPVAFYTRRLHPQAGIRISDCSAHYHERHQGYAASH